jgi:hypothetical protein
MDVFLSYNHLDIEVVTRIRTALAQARIATFFRSRSARPCLTWPSALENGLRASRAVVVFIGANGLGSWQKREV